MSPQLAVITVSGIVIIVLAAVFIVLAAVFIGYASVYYRQPYPFRAYPPREPERVLEKVRLD